MNEAIRQLRALERLAAEQDPDVERAAREELIDEMYFAYHEKWDRELGS